MLAVLVSHDLRTRGGVAAEAAKWADALETLGWTVREAAGWWGDVDRGDGHRQRVTITSLWRPDPTGPLPDVNPHEIEGALDGADLVIFDNAATLPSAPAAAIALADAARRRRLPVIVRHHDPAWQHHRRPHHPDFPLTPPGAAHVCINDYTRRQLADRGIDATVMYNRVDVSRFTPGDRAAARAALGVPDDVWLLAHPVRPYPRKRVDRARYEAVWVAAATGRPVWYWLTGGSDGQHRQTEGWGVVERHGAVADPAQLYAACDAAVMTSEWEGWGNGVVEAAACARPAVVWPYPITREIAGLGVDVAPLAHLGGDPWWRHAGDTPRWERSRAAVAANLNLADLPAELAGLLGRL